MTVDYLDSLVDFTESRKYLRIWPYPAIDNIDDYIVYASEPFQYVTYCFVDDWDIKNLEGWKVK
jgi:hypothetical protein